MSASAMDVEISQSEKRQRICNTEGKNRSLWLVKIPLFVAKEWAKGENEDILGKMQIVSKDGNKITRVTLEDGSEFTLEDLGTHPNMLAFAQQTDGRYAVSGKISKHMGLKPKGDDAYRMRIRNRTDKATEAASVRAVDESINSTLAEHSTMDFIPPLFAENKRKSAEIKAQRKRNHGAVQVDHRVLMESILSAFATGGKLLFREIIAHCQDKHPEVLEAFHEKEIREELEKYATYQAGGVHKQRWILKADYRDHSVTAASASSGSGPSSGKKSRHY